MKTGERATRIEAGRRYVVVSPRGHWYQGKATPHPTEPNGLRIGPWNVGANGDVFGSDYWVEEIPEPRNVGSGPSLRRGETDAARIATALERIAAALELRNAWDAS